MTLTSTSILKCMCELRLLREGVALRTLLILLALTSGLAACAKAKPDLRLSCAAIEGLEPLLAQPQVDVILIDGDESATSAATAIGCAAAKTRAKIVWAFPADNAGNTGFSTLIGG